MNMFIITDLFVILTIVCEDIVQYFFSKSVINFDLHRFASGISYMTDSKRTIFR